MGVPVEVEGRRDELEENTLFFGGRFELVDELPGERGEVMVGLVIHFYLSSSLYYSRGRSDLGICVMKEGML